MHSLCSGFLAGYLANSLLCSQQCYRRKPTRSGSMLRFSLKTPGVSHFHTSSFSSIPLASESFPSHFVNPSQRCFSLLDLGCAKPPVGLALPDVLKTNIRLHHGTSYLSHDSVVFLSIAINRLCLNFFCPKPPFAVVFLRAQVSLR